MIILKSNHIAIYIASCSLHAELAIAKLHAYAIVDHFAINI